MPNLLTGKKKGLTLYGRPLDKKKYQNKIDRSRQALEEELRKQGVSVDLYKTDGYYRTEKEIRKMMTARERRALDLLSARKKAKHAGVIARLTPRRKRGR